MGLQKITADDSFLVEYKERAEAGDVIIGQELYLELCNLVEDLNIYSYDRTNALLRIDFIEKCVKLTKDPFYGQPMVLMLWQKAFIETVYSFKMPNGNDRWRKILLMIGRKNGKTELCSALGLSELILGNPGSDIVAASNNDEQSKLTYNAIDTMRKLIDPKDLDTKKNISYILNKVNDSKVFRLSEKKHLDGFGVSTAIIDEIHEQKNNNLVKAMEQSQSVKESPKMFLITTNGFINGAYLDEELVKARKIIRHETDDPSSERYLPWLYTMDSEADVWDGNRDNRLWQKANPSLGDVKKWEYLETQVAAARESKSERIHILAKDFNIKQQQASAFLDYEEFTYDAKYDIKDFNGCFCLGAVDLAETTDLCAAKVLIMKPGDNTKYIISHYFIPESKLIDADDKSAGAKYEEWAREGHITIADGNDIDLSIVADWFYSLYKKHNIRLYKCGYDQKFARDWIKQMDVYGWTRTGGDDSDLIVVQQNAVTLSNAIKLVEADFKKQYINYNENPVDRWCFANAGLKTDEKGNCLIVKMESRKRIDGAVCLAILYETYRRVRTEFSQLGGL